MVRVRSKMTVCNKLKLGIEQVYNKKYCLCRLFCHDPLRVSQSKVNGVSYRR